MSYCSENKLPKTAPLRRVLEIIELLGYKKAYDSLKLENQVGSYFWAGNDSEISFVGVELMVYAESEYISVQTRSRAGRSYWDLKQQNKTISLLKSLFGGSFFTDEGNNRYMTFNVEEPSRISCALYLSRWIFHNAMIKPQIYLSSRELNGEIAREELTGLPWLDDLNPRVLSHNMLIPYVVASWESYLRQSYISILKYDGDVQDRALKNCRISNSDLLRIVRYSDSPAPMLADSLSFQRPSVAAENFKLLNSKIDIHRWLTKPFHRRKTSLFDSITELVELRNEIVHTGSMSLDMSEKKVKRTMTDLAEAADRVYSGFGEIYGFTPRTDY